MSDADRRAVSEFLAGRPLGAKHRIGGRIEVQRVAGDVGPVARRELERLGQRHRRTRGYAKTGGVTAADLPKLKLKWAFGYANVNAARAQPAYAGGRLFVASENAEVHALDPKTGCTYWTFVANSGVRTALSVGPYKTAGAAATRSTSAT